MYFSLRYLHKLKIRNDKQAGSNSYIVPSALNNVLTHNTGEYSLLHVAFVAPWCFPFREMIKGLDDGMNLAI